MSHCRASASLAWSGVNWNARGLAGEAPALQRLFMLGAALRPDEWLTPET